MTTGQKLVELSGLASGSALAHLLAVTQGTGTGVDRIIFASQMAVSIEDDQVSVIQRPSELSVSATPAQMQTTQKDKPNRITARSSLSRIDVTTRPAALYIAQKTHASTFVRTLPSTITSRRKRVIQST